MRITIMRIFRFLIPCLGLVFFIASCNDFKHLSDRGKFLVKSKENVFRGVSFDVSLQDVKNHEQITPEVEYADYLRYKILADSIAAGESLDVEYFFNRKNQLDLIIAFYNTQSDEVIKEVVDELKGYIENRHGRARQDEYGWYHWEFEDKGGLPGTIEINLVGETEEGYKGVELEVIKYYENERRPK